MTFASQFLESNLPVGSTLTGLSFPEPSWLIADGRAMLRTAYPLLSEKFPVGRMTGTARTLASVPAVPIIKPTASATGFIAIGATGTAALQATNNSGASWATITTPSITPSGLAVSGNYVYVLNAAAAQGAWSAGADTHTFSFAAVTGGPTGVVAGTSLSRLIEANISGFNHVLAIPSASGNVIYAVQAGNSAFTSLTLTETAIKQAACWTGTRLLIVKAGSANLFAVKLQMTPTLNAVPIGNISLPETVAAGQGNIASNGAGVVVISGVPSGLLVSFDNGVTFTPCNLPGVTLSDTWRVQFSGGYWMVETAQGTLFSSDAERWQLDSQVNQTFAVASAMAKIGNTVMQISAATAAFSLAQSTTEFNLPNIRRFGWIPSGVYVPLEPTYIKVK